MVLWIIYRVDSIHTTTGKACRKKFFSLFVLNIFLPMAHRILHKFSLCVRANAFLRQTVSSILRNQSCNSLLLLPLILIALPVMHLHGFRGELLSGSKPRFWWCFQHQQRCDRTFLPLNSWTSSFKIMIEGPSGMFIFEDKFAKSKPERIHRLIRVQTKVYFFLYVLPEHTLPNYFRRIV